MNDYQVNDSDFYYSSAAESRGMARTFISSVFSWMGIALAVTAIFSWVFATNQELFKTLYNPVGGMTTLGWVVMLAPFGLVLLMSFGFSKLSATSLTLVFLVYSILMGMSLSFIFFVYPIGDIFKTFGVTALLFGAMAVVGYTTKTDLTKFGSLLIMALVGIIIASLVNMFMHSARMDYIISIIGVLIFTGLTAYDVQKLQRIGSGLEFGQEATRKLSILGALTLYLDFINLFLFLLRLMGNRK